MRPRFFKDAAGFGAWLEANHDTAGELLVGFHKVGSGTRGITYREALDQALCFGWIDGVRKSLDARRYTIRFSRRRSKSVWSAINIRRARELSARGEMRAPGLEAFRRRAPEKSRTYSYENRPRALAAPYAAPFRERPRAWNFFQSQAPWYRRTCAFWVMSAKKEETRARRLDLLIACSEKGTRIPALADSGPAVRGARAQARTKARTEK